VNKDALKSAKRLLPLYREHIDPWSNGVSQIASCSRGCDHCCYILVGASLAEGALIAAHIMETPSWTSEIRELKTRLQEDSDFIRLTKGNPDKWQLTKKGCPFLNKKTHECRIYNYRPASCRTYFVTSDPAQCSPDKPGAGVHFVDADPVVVPFIEAMVDRTTGHIPTLTGSLQSMVLAGIELVSSSSPRFEKWLQFLQVDDMKGRANDSL
jgi:Fe-S-cluster containining protein